MKKIVLIVIGSLAGLYTLGAVVQFVAILLKTNFSSSYGVTNALTAGTIPCLSVALCLWCLKRAFRKRDTDGDDNDQPWEPLPMSARAIGERLSPDGQRRTVYATPDGRQFVLDAAGRPVYGSRLVQGDGQ